MRPAWLLWSCAGLLMAAGSSGTLGAPWKERPEKFTLTTGLPCVYQKDQSSPTTVVGLFAPGGKSAVPPGLDGLAYLTTRLTLEIPDEAMVQDLMSQATRLSLLCSEDFTAVLIECLSENLEDALRVAGKIIQDPLITSLRINRTKEMMKLYGRSEEDESTVAAHNAVMKAFFPGAGYGTAVYGTEESLGAIDRKDALAFYRRFFTKSNLFFCIGTDIEKEPVRALLEKYFAKFPDGDLAAIAPAPPALPSNREIALPKDTKQTYISRAFALPAPDAPNQAKGYLLETLLGKGPGSRLWGLRMTEKLAYSVDAEVTWTKNSGILEAYMETDNAKSPRASEALDRTLADLQDKGITEEELRTAKTMARTRFLRSMEAKAPRLRAVGFFEVLGLGYEHLSGIFTALDAVTLETMNAFIREALAPDRSLRVTVGPEPAGPTIR
ncbi:MAG: insulinase family protein [Acidobacteria bacterium]|nr:insulinase family protein [Acidobacteriota bacterium]